jgi:glycosyltransferase involved in cell wall biosynthesis
MANFPYVLLPGAARDVTQRAAWHIHAIPRRDRVRVTVLIPALNEAACLAQVLPHIPPWVDEVLLVDGHSTDRTVEVAQHLYPTIRSIVQEGRGKGAALRSGMAVATGDIIVTLDADGSMDPGEIPIFVGALLAGADYVKGSRFLQGAATADMPWQRRVANWGFVQLTNFLFGTHYTDITYGYNALWREHVPILAQVMDGWEHEIIGNIRAARSGLRVVEVACLERPRVAGDAKLRAFPAGWAILTAILREPFYKRPDPPPAPGAAHSIASYLRRPGALLHDPPVTVEPDAPDLYMPHSLAALRPPAPEPPVAPTRR